MKFVSIYLRRGFLLVRAAQRTEHGVWIGDGPCTKLDSASSPSEIGAAVLERLAASGCIIPHPTEWVEGQASPVLEAAGVKTWATFAKKARSVDVELDSDFLLIPTRNRGGGRFQHLPDKALRIPVGCLAVVLGEAITQALELCR